MCVFGGLGIVVMLGRLWDVGGVGVVGWGLGGGIFDG